MEADENYKKGHVNIENAPVNPSLIAPSLIIPPFPAPFPDCSVPFLLLLLLCDVLCLAVGLITLWLSVKNPLT